MRSNRSFSVQTQIVFNEINYFPQPIFKHFQIFSIVFAGTLFDWCYCLSFICQNVLLTGSFQWFCIAIGPKNGIDVKLKSIEMTEFFDLVEVSSKGWLNSGIKYLNDSFGIPFHQFFTRGPVGNRRDHHSMLIKAQTRMKFEACSFKGKYSTRIMLCKPKLLSQPRWPC